MNIFIDKKFYAYLNNQYSPLTVLRYISIISQFKVSKLSTQEYTQTLFKHVSKYRQWMACLKNYSRYLRFKGDKAGAFKINEMIESFKIRIKSQDKNHKLKKLQDKEAQVLTQAIKQTIESSKDYQYKIPYMITAFCLLNGLRISEAISVKRNDVRQEHQIFYLTIIGKGRKERTMVMDSLLSELYNSFIKDVPEDQERLFATLRERKPILRQDATIYIKKIFKELKLDWMSPHKLRHTFATKASKIIPTETLRDILGHENIATTSIYLHSDKSDQIEAMKKIKETRTKEGI